MKLFKHFFKERYGIHTAVEYELNDFINLIRTTKKYARKSVYFYTGSVDLLKSIITNPDGRGERDVNHLSLIYPDFKTYNESSKCLIMDEALFFPLIVSEITNVSKDLEQIRIETLDGVVRYAKYALICCDNIYLTSK